MDRAGWALHRDTHWSQTVTLDGTALQTLSGSAGITFDDLVLSNTISGDNDAIVLDTNITIDGVLTMSMATGDLLLNGQKIILGTAGSISGESSTDHIYGLTGSITATEVMSATNTYYDIAGLGIAIKTGGSQVPGSTDIIRTHAAETGNSNTSYIKSIRHLYNQYG